MIGNNSCGVRSVHGPVLRPRPALLGQRRTELEVLLYDGRRLTRSRRHLRRPRRDRPALLELRDRYADLIRDALPADPAPRLRLQPGRRCCPRSGFNVARALAGTESTCVTYLEATVHLLHSPPHRSLLVLGYEDAPAAGDARADGRSSTSRSALEGIDDAADRRHDRSSACTSTISRGFPDGHGCLLVEFGGDTEGGGRRAGAQADGELKLRQGRRRTG